MDHLKVVGKHTCSLTARNSEDNVYDKYLWPAFFFFFHFLPALSFLFRYHCFALLCFPFSLQGIVRRISYCDITHNKHIPQGGGHIKASVWGYNPFEMHLSVITHRQGWSPAWLWGATLPRCLAHTLTPPGLQQGLHTGILVSPLLCVPTNYLLKDSVKDLISLASLSQPFPLRPPIGYSPHRSRLDGLADFLLQFPHTYFQAREDISSVLQWVFLSSILKWPLLVQEVKIVMILTIKRL